MPLVRIDVRSGAYSPHVSRLGEVVYQAMVDVIDVPRNDNFQVITEHSKEGLVYDAGYLGIPRTDAIVFVQIVLNEGRTIAQKQALYRAIADGFHQRFAIRREDVLIVLIEVKKENWSFGNGVAQYAGPA